MSDYLLAVGIGVVGFIPAWKFYFLRAYRGDFKHAKTCYCPRCKENA